MNEKKQSTVKRILGTRGMGAVITAFAGLIIIYVAFGLIDRKVFAGQNVMNLLRSMSKYLLIGVGQSYLLITGNIDLSIGSMVGMSWNVDVHGPGRIQDGCVLRDRDLLAVDSKGCVRKPWPRGP